MGTEIRAQVLHRGEGGESYILSISKQGTRFKVRDIQIKMLTSQSQHGEPAQEQSSFTQSLRYQHNS